MLADVKSPNSNMHHCSVDWMIDQYRSSTPLQHVEGTTYRKYMFDDLTFDDCFVFTAHINQ